MTTLSTLDAAARQLVRKKTPQARHQESRALIREAKERGVYPAAIHNLYRALATDTIAPMTVPAMNIRGLTYDLARAVWRTVLKLEASAVMFELAPVEATVTDQTFDEYAALILSAAVREGYRGPVFLQGDHFTLKDTSEDSMNSLEALCRQVIEAGFYQIDLDAAALAQKHERAEDRQRANAFATSSLVTRLSPVAPPDMVFGGEVGEIGGANTSPDDLEAFVNLVREQIPEGKIGLGKVSVQTGTSHGGVVQADGRAGRMPLDVSLVQTLSTTAKALGLPGVVQHGASTLTFEQLGTLPNAGVHEVHLATGIQNLVFDHPALPTQLLGRMQREFANSQVTHAESGQYASDDALTPEQRFYKNRWRAWGPYKQALWDLPVEVHEAVRDDMSAWVEKLLITLNVAGRSHELQDLYSRSH